MLKKVSWKTEKSGRRNFKDTVMRFMWIRGDDRGTRKRITKFKRDGDRHFAEDGRVAEITIDLVLQARAKKIRSTGQKIPS